MTQVTKEELLKIAAMSALEVSEQEVPELLQHLESVLTYAARVQDHVGKTASNPTSTKLVNVFRKDVVVPTDSAPILAQAPDQESRYFVVPKILDN